LWTGGQRLCRYDTIREMTQLRALVVLLACFLPLAGQIPDDEPVTLSTAHPRLLLRPARLRLLRRERERDSMRWQQFHSLVSGGAPMPEPGFALALDYQIAGDAESGRKAVNWALGGGSDLRQLALVYDWCQDLMNDAQRRDLAARIAKSMAATENDASVSATRSRAMAAVALFDEVPDAPQKELTSIVHTWWEKQTAAALRQGRTAIARRDAYPLFELLHVIRDNTNFDLRESCVQFFKDYPIEHLLSYYPAPMQGPDTEYYIGADRATGEPDLRQAALSRAAELAMVAFDTNAASTQVIQGWLMHDRYILHSTFGAPYEFLWANPYQPGLSYYHVPLVYHNPDFGRLFIRSNWEDGARWFGDFDGVMQLFEAGKVSVVDPARSQPLGLTEAVVCFGSRARRFDVKLDEEEAVFVVGLEPRHTYLVEIDDEEMDEAVADPGGIIRLTPPRGKAVGIRLREETAETLPAH
jgi:hypothetical protein